jgi:hypothetical protein
MYEGKLAARCPAEAPRGHVNRDQGAAGLAGDPQSGVTRATRQVGNGLAWPHCQLPRDPIQISAGDSTEGVHLFGTILPIDFAPNAPANISQSCARYAVRCCVSIERV